MLEARISVTPVPGGWAVETEEGETTLFLNGGQAEAHGRRLGKALWQAGAPARVLIHNRDGDFVGAWRFGPDGADPMRPELNPAPRP
jgi:hypothetical protein